MYRLLRYDVSILQYESSHQNEKGIKMEYLNNIFMCPEARFFHPRKPYVFPQNFKLKKYIRTLYNNQDNFQTNKITSTFPERFLEILKISSKYRTDTFL